MQNEKTKTVLQRLDQAMKTYQISVEQLSETAGMEKERLIQIMQDEETTIDALELHAIAVALKVPMEYFYFEKHSDPESETLKNDFFLRYLRMSDEEREGFHKGYHDFLNKPEENL